MVVKKRIKAPKSKSKPKPKPEEQPDELLRQGVERAKRGLRGEDPDLRKKS